MISNLHNQADQTCVANSTYPKPERDVRGLRTCFTHGSRQVRTRARELRSAAFSFTCELPRQS